MKVDFQIYTFYIKLAALFQLVQQNVIIFSPQYEDWQFDLEPVWKWIDVLR